MREQLKTFPKSMGFQKPTTQERLDEAGEVARSMGNSPASVIFKPDGSSTTFIGTLSHFPQDSVGPNSEIIILKQGHPEVKNKKAQPLMKENQQRHRQNLSGLSGRYKGTYYTNGQPMERKNGNGKH